MEEAISMASKYLDMCPPVLAPLKAGTPIIAIETGFFMQLPYPRNLEALQECEQAFYRRDCVPCCVGIVNGRLKAGLSKQDMDTLCRSGGSCTRSQIPALVGGGSTSGTGPSATLAIARMAGIIPVMAPGLRDSLADLARVLRQGIAGQGAAFLLAGRAGAASARRGACGRVSRAARS